MARTRGGTSRKDDKSSSSSSDLPPPFHPFSPPSLRQQLRRRKRDRKGRRGGREGSGEPPIGSLSHLPSSACGCCFLLFLLPSHPHCTRAHQPKDEQERRQHVGRLLLLLLLLALPLFLPPCRDRLPVSSAERARTNPLPLPPSLPPSPGSCYSLSLPPTRQS